MNGIFLLLGSNLGDRLANLQTAVDILQSMEVQIVDYSSIYETAAWGEIDQHDFLNIVIRIDTFHEPISLLQTCLASERNMGRARLKKWGSRNIDIDILYYNNITETSPQLTLPHPAIAMRRFTLLPMVEIAPKEIHPLLQLSQKRLLEICPDELPCRLTDLNLIL